MEIEELEEAMAETSQMIYDKEKELKALRLEFASLKSRAAEIKEEACGGETTQMRQTVHELVHGQLDTAAACNSYENRVLALELQSLVDRYKLLDVEELAKQNHELRAEVLRLQQENFKLIQSVAEGDMRAKQHSAKIELALESTARAHFRQSHEELRKQLYEQMDVKSKILVHEHGALQAQVKELNKQAGLIDNRYRKMSTERQQFKVDADVADGMNEIMSKQNVMLRHQLDHALVANQILEEALEKAEARARGAEAQRSGVAQQWQQQTVGSTDCAEGARFGMPGDEQQQQGMQEQLERSRQLQSQLRSQRDVWMDRCRTHEKTIAELQTCWQASVEQRSLALPNGLQQSTESIWCADQVLSSMEPGFAPGSGRAAAEASPLGRQAAEAGRKLQEAAGARSRPASGQAPQPAGAAGRGSGSDGPGTGEASDPCEVASTNQAGAERAGEGGEAELSWAPARQQRDAGAEPPRGGGGEVLAGTVSLSRLLNDAMQPMHVAYPSAVQTHTSLIRAHRSPGSLRYSCARTSMVELYQGLDKEGSARPVSASDALAMNKKLWQQRQQARREGAQLSSAGAEDADRAASRPAAAGHGAWKGHGSSRPASAVPEGFGAAAHGSEGSRGLPVRPATAGVRPGAAQRGWARSGASPVPGAGMFRSHAGTLRPGSACFEGPAAAAVSSRRCFDG